MIEPVQMREMIEEILLSAPNPRLHSPVAVELLMLTAATESKLGRYFRQIRGPALGIFQVEPATERDLFENYLEYNRDLLSWVEDLEMNHDFNLKYNIAYQIAIARLVYFRKKDPLPSIELHELAAYWKKHYNTHLGKGTVEKAIGDYNRYVLLGVF